MCFGGLAWRRTAQVCSKVATSKSSVETDGLHARAANKNPHIREWPLALAYFAVGFYVDDAALLAQHHAKAPELAEARLGVRKKVPLASFPARPFSPTWDLSPCQLLTHGSHALQR